MMIRECMHMHASDATRCNAMQRDFLSIVTRRVFEIRPRTGGLMGLLDGLFRSGR